MAPPFLRSLESGGGSIETLKPQAWRLTIPAGPDRVYRLAQLDDYRGLARDKLHWQPPLTLSLRARASEESLLGTWGFGLWNDPFSLGFKIGGAGRRVPALPNTAWFFFASPPNYLSLRDDLPTRGLLAATFSSPKLPAVLFPLGIPFIPLLFWRPLARLLRSCVRRWIRQSAVQVETSLTAWHTYSIFWESDSVAFGVDGETVPKMEVSPLGPLGLVLWIDNQYAAFTPRGSLAFGTLPNPHRGWLEIADLEINMVHG
ncbi:MAG TPA: hypothetical protein VMT46_05335 [Anaerolineaceae bacterium]|nr:hypothetical protein [Anaerolineaceae bacterium]